MPARGDEDRGTGYWKLASFLTEQQDGTPLGKLWIAFYVL